MPAFSAGLFWLVVHVFALHSSRADLICSDDGWQLKEFSCSDASREAACWKCYKCRGYFSPEDNWVPHNFCADISVTQIFETRSILAASLPQTNTHSDPTPPQHLFAGCRQICRRKFHHEPRTWYEARTHCEEEGGRLVKLESEEENAFVVAAMWSTPKPDASVVDPLKIDAWIGLYTPRRNCDFFWTDATPFGDFHPWDADEPSKCYRGQGRYCAKLHGYYGVWVADGCTVPLPSVCEKDPVEQGVSRIE